MAIAFDTATDGGITASGTSLTWSHTCTGSDLLLRVGVRGTLEATDRITGVTYNGVAMTLIARVQNAFPDRWISLWELVGPASGANDVVVSSSPADVIIGQSASYTGADAHDADNTATGSSVDTLACSATPVADGCWLQGVQGNHIGNPNAGTATTKRIGTGNGMGLFDNNGAISPPALTTLTVTTGSAAVPAMIVATIVPAGGGGGGSTKRRPQRLLMGVN